MKANELRIGNWINHKYSPPSFIVSVINTFNENTVNGIELEDCEPITLTEEWLLKFGFEKSGEPYIIENFAVEENGLNWYLYMYDEENGCDVNIGIIQYVHQLQNLYFALTGEELTTHHE